MKRVVGLCGLLGKELAARSTAECLQSGGPLVNGGLHVALDEADFLAVFPLKGSRRARLIGTLEWGMDRPTGTLRMRAGSNIAEPVRAFALPLLTPRRQATVQAFQRPGLQIGRVWDR